MDLPGLDLERLHSYLDRELPGLAGPALQASLIPGGRSNLTYDVTDGSTHLVVRRPPLGHVLATAHDMSREHTVMSALADSAVPVPTTYALCEDDTVLGAPFYVMSKAAGVAYRAAGDLDQLGADRTADISTRLVDTLVALHDVDPTAAGLQGFGRPDGFAARQVERWHRQLEASRSRDIDGVDDLLAYLRTHVPARSDATIVHGDYRLDNVLVDAGQSGDPITAVLDWEMATLGDPLTDVALLVAYQQLATTSSAALIADAPTAAGFLSVDDVLARYQEGSGRDLSAMGFYLALAYFKLAVVLEGIHYRYTQGKTVGAGFAEIGTMVQPLVASGLAARTSP